jgi:Ras GTPase-activating-like protein IQGAP1
VSSQDPPIKIVRKFLHLLDQSDVDFGEELGKQADSFFCLFPCLSLCIFLFLVPPAHHGIFIVELQNLKAQVVTEIRSNQQLEHDLQGMDIKIGLLVRNKITLQVSELNALSQITSANSWYNNNLITSCVFFQDVIIHNKKLSRKDQDLQSLASSNTKGIRSLSKESQEKLEAYQNLFYLLQTNPVYLAKLIFEMPQSRSTNFMESVILTLYNYASNTREEYLLLKLFETALREEIL